MTYEEIKTNAEIEALINKGNNNLGKLGYTEHGKAHGTFVAQRAAYVLEQLGYSEHDKELARIAGYMHDIGNSVNRSHHAEYGALLANSILEKTDISMEDRITIMSAIGNHDESTGRAMDPVSAALIIADKTDVRRSRVGNSRNQLSIFMIELIMQLRNQTLFTVMRIKHLHLI